MDLEYLCVNGTIKFGRFPLSLIDTMKHVESYFFNVSVRHILRMHINEYAEGLSFVILCSGLVKVNCTHILNGYFTGTGVTLMFLQYQWGNPGKIWRIQPQELHYNQITTKPCSYPLPVAMPQFDPLFCIEIKYLQIL